MPTIFIVMRAGGYYEDAWQEIVCARSTRESAQAVVDRTNRRDQHNREVAKRLNAHMKEWVPPTVAIPCPKLVTIPTFPPGFGPLTERAEQARAAIEQEHDKRMAAYRENAQVLHKERMQERLRFLVEEETRYLIDVEGLTVSEAQAQATLTRHEWQAPGDNVCNYFEETELE